MKRITTFTLVLILSGFAAFTQDVSDLFYRAVHLQEVKGDLEAAIPLFEKIVSESKDPSLAAKAQLRIGMCYEMMGRAEAYNAYAKVIDRFAQQTETARTARGRISGLNKARSADIDPAKGLNLAKIYTGMNYVFSISPNEKRLAFIRQDDIWTTDIATDAEVRLTNGANCRSEGLWSPDSQWIAFLDGGKHIRAVSVDDGRLLTLVALDPDTSNTGEVRITGWTADSGKVLFHMAAMGLFAIPLGGGEMESIHTFQNPGDAKRYEDMTLSPDGRWIAYHATRSGNTDIYVMPVKGGESIRITANPAVDRTPRWSYDGNWLAFNSYSTENPQIWIIKISPEGLPEGPPLQVTKDTYILGGHWTIHGNIGFWAAFRTEHVYVANIDGTHETQLTQFPCANHRPRWSPDGEMIAFRSDYRRSLNAFQLWTVPSKGGNARLVVDQEIGGFLWTPDGRILFVTRKEPHRIMEIAAGGGEPREVMKTTGEIGFDDWSPDGQSIIYTYDIAPPQFANAREYLRERLSGISILSLRSGGSRSIIPADKKGIWYSDCRWSPDGSRIAYIVYEVAQNGKEGGYSIWTMDADGGATRLITRGGEYVLCWSADGKSIVYERRIKDMDFELCRVAADGGEPVKMNIIGRSPDISPDGKKIAFSRRIGQGYEFWLAENLLPAEGKGVRP